MPIPAAQYVRMSTEHQQYSISNQTRLIFEYAKNRGFVIVRSFEDPGKSGLSLKSRPALKELLNEVVSGNATFKAILVYDVSRWGRFQDVDEAAHYEFLCRSAGIPIHYCAEQFVNQGSMESAILKTLKRAMAAEFSRELGEKVYRGQCQLVRMGFKMGGRSTYVLRRMLVSSDGIPKHDFGILKWPTLAVCFGPPLDTTNFYSGFEHELGSGGWGWTGEPRWSCSSRFGWSMSLG